jgi:Uma2 family endonuclease
MTQTVNFEIRPAAYFRYRLTVTEFEALSRSGALPEGKRFELLEGELYEMVTMGESHTGLVINLNSELAVKLYKLARVSPQCPIQLEQNDSQPEPDFALVYPERYVGGIPHARDLALVVEISDSSLDKDRSLKLPIYAREGIPEVWILNVSTAQLEVYSEPLRGEYRSRRIYDSGQSVAPLAFAEVQIEWWVK